MASKFEKHALELLEEGENVEKVVSKAYRKAQSKVKTQISLLEGEIVELEEKIEDAEDNIKEVQYSVDFDIDAYDEAASTLEILKEDLEAVEETLKNRKELLDSWK